MSELEHYIEQINSVKPLNEVAEGGVSYKVHPLRRDMRYKVFLFINTGTESFPGLKEHFEKQFKKGWSWENFTFVWDLSPTNPLKAIPEREWLVEGGAALDPREGEVFTAARYYPNGFTAQRR